MKNAVLAFVGSVILALPGAFAADEKQGKIIVDIFGLRNDNGVVRVALFNSEDSYKGDKDNDGDTAFRKTTAPIKDKHAACEFENVPHGTYVVKFFHDEDNSGKFVTGMFGIPKVEYGFSNNAKAMFGPPSFDKASFDFKGQELTLKIGSQGK